MGVISKPECYYNAEDLNEIGKEYKNVLEECDRLLLRYINLSFKNPKSSEFAKHGFARRVKTLKKCLENIFSICPADRVDKLSGDELTNVCINLQSFIFNIFGCIDNLAWIWVNEKNFSFKKKTEVKFSNKNIKSVLSRDFSEYLDGLKDWLTYLEDFRHSLAHRIPLYIPPYVLDLEDQERSNFLELNKNEALKKRNYETYHRLNKDQENLGLFRPWMKHSFEENSKPVAFHVQMLVDVKTISEISQKFLKELED